MTLLPARGAVLALTFLAVAMPWDGAAAKKWTAGPYQCQDGVQVRVTNGVPISIGNGPSTTDDNVGGCILMCNKDPKCKTVNINHTPTGGKDVTTCHLYAAPKVSFSIFRSVQDKQWGAVCTKK